MARGRGRQSRAVVSSAVRVRVKPGRDARRISAEWQERAMAYYDALGEIWYAAQFYARTLSKLELVVKMRNEEGELEDTDDPVAWAALDRIKGPAGSDRAELQASYGRLRFLCGECFLFCHVEEESGDECWEILSHWELTFKDGKILRKTTPKAQGTEYADADVEAVIPPDAATALAWRFWVRHPQYSGMADSPMKGVLEPCEELLILGHAIRAAGRSRAQGAGVLFLPDSISPPPVPQANQSGGDENPLNDPFMDDLTQSMTAPIGDEGTASAVVPLIVRANGEAIAQVRHLTLAKEDHAATQRNERQECIERIALGLDLPPEVLLGVTDANHWTAWQIDEDSWKAHVEPVADAMVRDLTTAYMTPTLLQAGHANYDQIVISYDASDVVRRPDKSGDAVTLYDRFLLSGEVTRREAGFEDSDAPDPAEIDERIARTPTPPDRPPPDAEKPGAPKDPKPDATGDTGPPEQAAQVGRIEAAVDLMVDRARELAGSRIRTRLRGDPDSLALIRFVPNRLVAATLVANRGALPERCGDIDGLVAGGCECYTARLERWGCHPDIVRQLVQAAEEHARDTLHEQFPETVPVDIAKLLVLAEAGVS